MPDSTVVVNVQGLSDLEEKLKNLLPKQAKEMLRRAAKKGGEILQNAIAENAPRDTGALAEAISIQTKAGAGEAEDASGSIMVMTGPDKPHYYGMFQEFGTVNQQAQPFVRPAFEDNAQAVLDEFVRALQTSLGK